MREPRVDESQRQVPHSPNAAKERRREHRCMAGLQARQPGSSPKPAISASMTTEGMKLTE